MNVISVFEILLLGHGSELCRNNPTQTVDIVWTDVPKYVLPTSEGFAIRDAPSSSLRKEELLQQLYRKLGNLFSLHASVGENIHAGKHFIMCKV